jgi:hypothetical protein
VIHAVHQGLVWTAQSVNEEAGSFGEAKRALDDIRDIARDLVRDEGLLDEDKLKDVDSVGGALKELGEKCSDAGAAAKSLLKDIRKARRAAQKAWDELPKDQQKEIPRPI